MTGESETSSGYGSSSDGESSSNDESSSDDGSSSDDENEISAEQNDLKVQNKEQKEKLEKKYEKLTKREFLSETFSDRYLRIVEAQKHWIVLDDKKIFIFKKMLREVIPSAWFLVHLMPPLSKEITKVDEEIYKKIAIQALLSDIKVYETRENKREIDLLDNLRTWQLTKKHAAWFNMTATGKNREDAGAPFFQQIFVYRIFVRQEKAKTSARTFNYYETTEFVLCSVPCFELQRMEQEDLAVMQLLIVNRNTGEVLIHLGFYQIPKKIGFLDILTKIEFLVEKNKFEYSLLRMLAGEWITDPNYNFSEENRLKQGYDKTQWEGFKRMNDVVNGAVKRFFNEIKDAEEGEVILDNETTTLQERLFNDVFNLSKPNLTIDVGSGPLPESHRKEFFEVLNKIPAGRIRPISELIEEGTGIEEPPAIEDNEIINKEDIYNEFYDVGALEKKNIERASLLFNRFDNILDEEKIVITKQVAELKRKGELKLANQEIEDLEIQVRLKDVEIKMYTRYIEGLQQSQQKLRNLIRDKQEQADKEAEIAKQNEIKSDAERKKKLQARKYVMDED